MLKKNKMKFNLFLVVLLTFGFTFNSCAKKDDGAQKSAIEYFYCGALSVVKFTLNDKAAKVPFAPLGTTLNSDRVKTKNHQLTLMTSVLNEQIGALTNHFDFKQSEFNKTDIKKVIEEILNTHKEKLLKIKNTVKGLEKMTSEIYKANIELAAQLSKIEEKYCDLLKYDIVY